MPHLAKSYAGVQALGCSRTVFVSPVRGAKKRGGDHEGTPPSSDVTESALCIAATLLIVLIGLGALLSTTWLLVLLLLVVGLLLLFRLLFVLIRLVAVLIAHGSLLGFEKLREELALRKRAAITTSGTCCLCGE